MYALCYIKSDSRISEAKKRRLYANALNIISVDLILKVSKSIASFLVFIDIHCLQDRIRDMPYWI